MSAEPKKETGSLDEWKAVVGRQAKRIAELERQLAEARALLTVEGLAKAIQSAKVNGQRMRFSDEYAEEIARAVLSPVEDKPPASRGEPKGE